MPGGPTDPEILANFIKQPGCTWSSNHLVFESASYWPRIDGDDWIATTTPASLIDQDAFNMLRSCTVSGNFVIVNALRYEVVQVTIEGATWCTLLPA